MNALKLLLAGIFFLHLGLAALSFVTLDAGFGEGPLRSVFDIAVETYEFVGFGHLALGMLVVTVILVLPWGLLIREPG